MDSSSYGGPSPSAYGGDGDASPAQPAQAQLPSPTSQSSWCEVQKRRDWSTFGQYLRNHRPPLNLAQCSGADVLEFLRYLDQFGNTKVHTAACPFFGHPSPPAPCPCPLRQAWGSLRAIVDRLRAAYEENGGHPESNPFAARSVRLYLFEVRMHQARAGGIRIRPTTSSGFSKEEREQQELDQEEEESEAASPREIPFMTAAAATTAAASSSSSTSFSPSAADSASTLTSASGSPFPSNDSAGAAGSGGGGGGGVDVEVIEKEHMFEKVVTPSDVGKLNRMTIPKQYAEKYFPLVAAANEKGLLLSFEDRTGKLWRFRYSYWNNNQSYVLTKGWGLFVKEKRLDAGDTVSFCRGAAEATRDRLFIDWRRRADRLPRLPLPMPAASPYGPWGAGAGGFFIPPAPPTASATVNSYEKKKHKRAHLMGVDLDLWAAAAQVASKCRDSGGWRDESGGSAAAASSAEAGMWAGGRLQHQVPFDS